MRPQRRLCIHAHVVVEVVGDGVELAEAEAAPGLGLLHQLVDQLLDLLGGLDIFDLQLCGGLVGGDDGDGATPKIIWPRLRLREMSRTR